MALDLGLTTYQLLSVLDGLAPNIQSRSRRLDDAIDRALAVPADEGAFRTAAVGRRPYIAARTGPESLLGSPGYRPRFPRTGPRCPWTAPTSTWTAPAPALPPHQPGRAITYGASYGCQLLSERPAMDDNDLPLRPPMALPASPHRWPLPRYV